MVALDADRQAEVRQGDRVTVTMPDGTTTTSGRVTAVSRVASFANGQGQGQGQGQEAGGGQSGPATISVTVSLDHPGVAGSLDQAPVQVTITTQVHRHVLTAPITALLAHPGGGYDVWVVSGASRHRVPVRTGLFDDSGGIVEISGPGVAAGMLVEVPAQ
jgi:hypothetical protein